MGERAACRDYPPGSGICGICGIWGTCGFCGGVTVSVTVLVLVLVLTDVLGSVVVVVLGELVVSVLVDGGDVVSVTVWVGATSGADVVAGRRGGGLGAVRRIRHQTHHQPNDQGEHQRDDRAERDQGRGLAIPGNRRLGRLARLLAVAVAVVGRVGGRLSSE